MESSCSQEAVAGAVYLFLHQGPPGLAPGSHVRLTGPFDGMCCRYSLIDPENRMMVHRLIHHGRFGMDVEALFVVNVAHIRTVGI